MKFRVSRWTPNSPLSTWDALALGKLLTTVWNLVMDQVFLRIILNIYISSYSYLNDDKDIKNYANRVLGAHFPDLNTEDF